MNSNLEQLKDKLKACSHLVILTGAGVSAESGVPTFRGAGGLWRTYKATDLACPDAFKSNPSLVWQFYHYRRELVLSKTPNAAHCAIADCARRFAADGKSVVVITQNIDELHKQAGSSDVIELHGSLFKTRCVECQHVATNRDSPICEALGHAAHLPDSEAPDIPVSQLPHCQQTRCGGLLRPHVVWFGEELAGDVLERAHDELERCDLCLLAGTSSVVYPAAMFAPAVAKRGVPVAEFNLEATPATEQLARRKGFFFPGPCSQTLSEALAP